MSRISSGFNEAAGIPRGRRGRTPANDIALPVLQ